MNNYIIRKLNKDDYDKYLIMINEFRETEFTKEKFIETLNYIQPFSEIWVIEYEDDIISTGTILYETKFIYNNGKLAHIEDICVKKQYRKTGLGKIIVNHLMKVAKEQSCYKVTLVCNESNANFYKKCGMENRGLQMSQLTSNF
uniref:N-acetyltransferase domain-containing protein n=1 Tax=viral metagenome TaxID=1070528 RepID=A0A6C0ESA0_9ZZZZ